MTDNVFVELFSNENSVHKTVNTINLRFCNRLTANSIRCILQNCSELKVLDFSGCMKVDLDIIFRGCYYNLPLKTLIVDYFPISGN